MWSRAALASKWHKAEVNMARHIELYRRFEYRMIHIFIDDLSEVIDESSKLILISGEYMQWNKEATDAQKQKVLDRLLSKVYSRMT